MDASIYNFDNPHEFLSAVYSFKKKKNPSFSLRAWSQQLGFKNPSMLSSVLRKTRSLRPALVSRIAHNLTMTENERRYFELLSLIHNASTPEEKTLYIDLARSLRPEQAVFNLELEQFRLIADWHHLAILEMIELKDFDPTPSAIAKRLGGAIEPAMAATALERLMSLGLARKNAAGLYEKTSAELYVGKGISNEAIRAHHLQMIEQSVEALKHDETFDRNIQSTSIPVMKKDIPKAVELIN
ncbi:MAG: TIGR02147 family protein, partial [Proteobacteria bacterium]|nr:TIGR02147 family protein [Pseudomonadota bacterium]